MYADEDIFVQIPNDKGSNVMMDIALGGVRVSASAIFCSKLTQGRIRYPFPGNLPNATVLSHKCLIFTRGIGRTKRLKTDIFFFLSLRLVQRLAKYVRR